MLDEKARFHVEFVKEPRDIDQAVYATVCFQETKTRKNKHYTTDIRGTEISFSDGSDDDTHIARALPGKNKHKLIKHDKDTNTVTDSETMSAEKVAEIVRSELQSFQNSNNSYQRQYQRPRNTQSYYQGQGQRNTQSYYQGQGHRNYQNRKGACYECGEYSHIKRNCPKLNQKQTNDVSNENQQNPQNLN